MKDGFGREVTYMRVSVTDRCNLRCRYCMPEEGVEHKAHSDILSLENIGEVVRAAVGLGVNKIRITGGEPLVRKGITELVKDLSGIAGVSDLAMTTNAILLPEYAQELKSAGLMRLNISLDTLDADKFRKITRIGELKDVIKGIRAALDSGFAPLRINTVLIGGFNTDEISALTALTSQYPIELRFIELMPFNAGAFTREAYVPCSVVTDTVSELREIGERGNVRLFALPGAPGKVGLIEPVSRPFCDSCNRIRLTADGKIKPCLHSSAEFNICGLHAEALTERIAEAIQAKPECHASLGYGQITDSGRTMNRIGG